MNNMLYISCAAAAVLLIVTIVLCIRNRCEDEGLLCVKEIPLTAMMGLMMIVLGVWMVYLKLIDPTVAGTDRDSYLFVAVFSLVCHLMGDFCLLYTFVKRVVVFNDRVEECSAFGKRRTMYWTEVVKIEKPVTRKAFKLHDKVGNVITVSGADKAYKEFADIAKDKIKSSQGRDLLNVVENRLRGKHL